MSKDGSMYLSESHSYFYQLQTQMHVTHLQWCDFGVWSPHDIFVQQIKYDPVFMKSAISTTGKFYFQHFQPAVIPHVIIPPAGLLSPNFSVPSISAAVQTPVSIAVQTSVSTAAQTVSVAAKMLVSIATQSVSAADNMPVSIVSQRVNVVAEMPVSAAAKMPVSAAVKMPVSVAAKIPVSIATQRVSVAAKMPVSIATQRVNVASKIPVSVAAKMPVRVASKIPVSVDGKMPVSVAANILLPVSFLPRYHLVLLNLMPRHQIHCYPRTLHYQPLGQLFRHPVVWKRQLSQLMKMSKL